MTIPQLHRVSRFLLAGLAASLLAGCAASSRSIMQAAPSNELWVIESSDGTRSLAADRLPEPGGGVLLARLNGAANLTTLPLARTDVNASIAGFVARVNVKQTFHNPFAARIDALYVFPLPPHAAVNEFILTIGARHIRGIIRPREEAEQIYREARSQGYVVTLMKEGESSLFVQQAANLEPGRSVQTELTYFSTLAYDRGGYAFSFPMTLRTRSPGAGPRTPGTRSGREVGVSVHLDSGTALGLVETPNHTASVKRPSAQQADIELTPADSIPNTDFVLRYQLAAAPTAAWLAQRDSQGGVFALMILPPPEPQRAVSSLSVDWGGLSVSDVYPREMPKAIIGQPLILLGRFTGAATAVIRVKGLCGDRPLEMIVPVDPHQTLPGPAALPFLWAQAKVDDLMASQPAPPEGLEQIRRLALEYGLLCPQTAFVAVDSLSRAR